jgi:hypothetical protein
MDEIEKKNYIRRKKIELLDSEIEKYLYIQLKKKPKNLLSITNQKYL